MSGKVTYRQKYTRCGKKQCSICREGEGHGPYWYAYWTEHGRTISRYMGINPPTELIASDIFSTPTQESATAERNQAVASLKAHPFQPSNASPIEVLSIPPTSSQQVHKQSSNALATHQAAGKPGERIPVVQDASKLIAHRQESGKVALATPEGRKPSEEQEHSRPQFPLHAPGPYTVLRIYLFGQFRIERKIGDAWQMIVNRAWQKRRARALLGCLLSQVGRRMGREQVMEALWPDLDLETASNRLNGAVHELRQILEPGIARPASSKLLRLEHDILILADSAIIWVDADAFEGLLRRANTLTELSRLEEILEEAAKLYAGDYLLEELYSQWAATRREALRRSWMGMLLELARLRAARHAFNSAIEPLDRLLKADPTNETAVRRLMMLLTQLDRRGEAMQVYQRLADTLRQEYESEPLSETIQLYEDLCRGPAPVRGNLANSDYAQNDIGHSRLAVSEEPGLEGEWDQEISPLRTPPLRRHKQSPLIGRTQEMVTLREVLLAIERIPPHAVETARQKPGAPGSDPEPAHFAMLMGESGIGKTRLAEEISHEAQARGWLVIWTRSYEQENTIPYHLWTDLLRTLLQDLSLNQLVLMFEAKHGIAGTLNPAATAQSTLARLSALLPELASHQEFHLLSTGLTLPEQERLYLWEAVLTLLRVVSQSRPLLIVLDDLHWTADSSLELLTYLAHHQSNERLLWVSTCRKMEMSPHSRLHSLLDYLRREHALVTLVLQPLSSHQIARLIMHLPQQTVQHIQSQAGGNPFFAEELARFSEITSLESLESQNALNASSSTNHEIRAFLLHNSTLPETISTVLERRLHTLNAECRTLLSKAAVLGGSFELRTLLRMTGETDLSEDRMLDLLEAALHAGLLTEVVSGSRIIYHFWHPLIVDHLYERFSAARRAQLHRRAASALIELHPDDEREVAAAIVHHLNKYGQEPRKLAYYAEMAGNQAHLLSAFPEALYYYRLAWEARQSLAQTATHQEQAPAPFHCADLLECLAECNAIQGNYQESRQQYTQALALRQEHQYTPDMFADLEAYRAWQQEEAQIQALILRELGRAHRRAGEFHQAHECAEKGRQVLRSASLTGGRAWACLQHLDSSSYWLEGNFDEARRCVQECLEICQETLHQEVEQKEAYKDQIAQMHKPTFVLAIRRHISLNDPLELGWIHETLGVIEMSAGSYVKSLAHLHTALRIFEEHDLVRGMSLVCSNIGAVNALRCDYPTANTYLQRSLEIVERTGEVFSKALATGNLGDIAAHTGNLHDAQAWITNSLALAEQMLIREHSSWALIMLGIIQQDLGNMRGALETLRRALSMAHTIKSSVRLGFALVALADWRLTQVLSEMHLNSGNPSRPLAFHPQLRSALVALKRALSLGGIDAETRSLGQITQARIFYLLGDVEQAHQQMQQTLEEAQRRAAIYVCVRAGCLLAEIQEARGLRREADSTFTDAIQASKQYGLRLDLARALYRYSICQLRRRSPAAVEQGFASLNEARTILQTCQAALDLQWVEHLLAKHSSRRSLL